ncbi:hypothetical protein J6590_002202, partial [Homalodisca vitripennis]
GLPCIRSCILLQTTFYHAECCFNYEIILPKYGTDRYADMAAGRSEGYGKVNSTTSPAESLA